MILYSAAAISASFFAFFSCCVASAFIFFISSAVCPAFPSLPSSVSSELPPSNGSDIPEALKKAKEISSPYIMRTPCQTVRSPSLVSPARDVKTTQHSLIFSGASPHASAHFSRRASNTELFASALSDSRHISGESSPAPSAPSGTIISYSSLRICTFFSGAGAGTNGVSFEISARLFSASLTFSRSFSTFSRALSTAIWESVVSKVIRVSPAFTVSPSLTHIAFTFLVLPR